MGPACQTFNIFLNIFKNIKTLTVRALADVSRRHGRPERPCGARRRRTRRRGGKRAGTLEPRGDGEPGTGGAGTKRSPEHRRRWRLQRRSSGGSAGTLQGTKKIRPRPWEGSPEHGEADGVLGEAGGRPEEEIGRRRPSAGGGEDRDVGADSGRPGSRESARRKREARRR